MTLGWENVTVTRTNGSADVFRLTGFFRDDDLISQDGLSGVLLQRRTRTYSEQNKFTRRISLGGILNWCETPGTS
jgi:hypothetical protein